MHCGGSNIQSIHCTCVTDIYDIYIYIHTRGRDIHIYYSVSSIIINSITFLFVMGSSCTSQCCSQTNEQKIWATIYQFGLLLFFVFFLYVVYYYWATSTMGPTVAAASSSVVVATSAAPVATAAACPMQLPSGAQCHVIAYGQCQCTNPMTLQTFVYAI